MINMKAMLKCLCFAKRLNSFQKCGCKTFASFVKIRDDVARAISENQPVVALESTIITHGLPYPENLNTALSVEKIVQRLGALPATIGILDGDLIIGMSESEVKHLAELKDVAIKTSRRDLSYVISRRLSGGTTVSATMVAANMAGIDVFVTGGIGGVHRGASETFDISADLMELSRTPIAVVCSGVKSILDIGLTLEYLETQGVPVISFGTSRYFPAFFTPMSKFKAPYNTESIEEIAKMINYQSLMKLRNGMVIGVPVPSADSSNYLVMEEVIENALNEARSLNVVGKDITPFVLGKIVKLTDGDSLTSNIRLIENNAKIGAQISLELSKLKSKNLSSSSKSRILKSYERKVSVENEKIRIKRPVVIGGSIFDIKATVEKISEIPDETNVGKLYTSFGGVGRNIAECLNRMGANPFLISSVGKDHQGEMILNNMNTLSMDTSGIIISDLPTASYSAVAKSDGELIMGIGDMDSHDGVTPETILDFKENIKDAGIVILDGNIPTTTLHTALKLCSEYDIPTWFEPTCVGKSVRPFQEDLRSTITYISPNIEELRAIHAVLEHIKNGEMIDTEFIKDKLILECLFLSQNILHHVDNLLITLGKYGVLVVSKIYSNLVSPSYTVEKHMFNSRDKCSISVRHYPPANDNLLPVTVKSVSGAGDSFAAGVIFGLLHGFDTDTCIKSGLFAANKSLNTYVAISHEISPEGTTYKKIHDWANFMGRVIM